MPALPESRYDLDVVQFRSWLWQRGHVIRVPTSEHVLLTWATPNPEKKGSPQHGHIVANPNGRLLWFGNSEHLYKQFASSNHQRRPIVVYGKNNSPPSHQPAQRVPKLPKPKPSPGPVYTERKMALVAKRDGPRCWYCGWTSRHKPVEQMTKEHLLAVSCGGSQALENLALACKKCNSEAGSLAVTQKVELRERKQRERLARVWFNVKTTVRIVPPREP